MTARSFAVFASLAVFASHYACAFRHNIAATIDLGSTLDVANELADKHITDHQPSGGPPSTDQVAEAVDGVIAEKVKKHQATMAAAMDAMQNLASATPGAPSSVAGKDSNVHARNETLRLTNQLAEANVEKKRAEDIRAYVESMITACKDLFAQVKRHEKDSKTRDVFEQQQGAARLDHAMNKIRKKVIEAEARDLHSLLTKVKAIREAQAEVVRLDELVQAGASEGIAAATQGVYDFTGTLEARAKAVSKKKSLNSWPPLEADGVQAEISSKAQLAVKKANVELERLQKQHAATLQQAMAQMNVLAGSLKASNKTDMDALTQQLFQANIQKANSEELQRAVTRTIELINAFFEIFNAFKEGVPVRMATANTGAINAQKETAAEIKTAVDKGDLQDISGFFFFYQVIWTRYQEAEAQMPEGDADYTKLQREMEQLAQDIHVWLNTGMLPYCEKHGSCQDVRGKLMAILENGNYWCDERDIKSCKTMGHGRQPNGKMCKWVTPFDVGHHSYAHVADGSSQGSWSPPGSGEQSKCKQNNPPTASLPFGRDSDSPGLFY